MKEVAALQLAVAGEYRIAVTDIKGRAHNVFTVAPRHLAMSLSLALWNMSLADVGARFDRHHTSVLNARRKSFDRIARDWDAATMAARCLSRFDAILASRAHLADLRDAYPGGAPLAYIRPPAAIALKAQPLPIWFAAALAPQPRFHLRFAKPRMGAGRIIIRRNAAGATLNAAAFGDPAREAALP